MSQNGQMTDGQMKKCPKCNEDIQSLAKKCKHCGADLRNWFVRHKIVTVILALIVIGAIGSASGEGDSKKSGNTSAASTEGVQEPIKPQEPSTIKITASELYSEYEANEIAADMKYKGKILEVTGTLDNIAKGILDDPYITLKTQHVIGSVQCMLKESEQTKAAALKTGSRITVRGQGGGKTLNVLVKNCEIIQ